MAAKKTKIAAVKELLRDDQNLFFEKQARQLLESVNQKGLDLGMTAEEIDKEVANEVLLLALRRA